MNDIRSFSFLSCTEQHIIENGDVPVLNSLSMIERRNHTRPFYTRQKYQKSVKGLNVSDLQSNSNHYLYMKHEAINENINYGALLRNTINTYSLTYAQQYRHHISNQPFFFEDDKNTYFACRNLKICCEKSFQPNIINYDKGFKFEYFYEPYICTFQQAIAENGVWGLLSPREKDSNSAVLINQADNEPPRQQHHIGAHTIFEKEYHPTNEVTTRPIKNIDFSSGSAYGIYHWELFFHLPMLIADQLLDQGKFEQSLKWLHATFNPSKPQEMVNDDGNSITVYWRIKPFVEEVRQGMFARLQDYVNPDVTDPDYLERRDELAKQSSAWKKDPFNPHGIAKYRPHAYMMNVVFKYLDVLIAWGDNLFRRDTMESVAEATQIYVIAAELLGKKPQEAPEQDKNPLSYKDLTKGSSGELLDTYISLGIDCHEMSADYDTSLPFDLSYFCVPANPKLLEYWETIADRLFKLRNCMDIDGNIRKLALFELPIDPAALIRARAAGLSLSDALSDLYAPLPHYRFTYMLAKANEFCNDVKSLGGSLLSAIEKGDNEELSQIRSVQEINVLKATRNIRKMQIDEAKKNLDGLHQSKKLAEFRKNEYDSRLEISNGENIYLKKLEKANGLQDKERIGMGTAAFLAPFDFDGGLTLSKHFRASHVGDLAARVFGIFAGRRLYEGNSASTKAGYSRRKEDWDFQAALAEQEIKQIEEQIAAAEIRLKMAEKELENHDRQIENAQEIYTFAKEKFSSEALYRWMSRRLTTIYRQTYGMAHDLAKQAQRAANFELGLADDISVVQADNWDSAKQGLLSGENLGLQLRQLETRYMQVNKREMEISKTISLRLLDGNALMELITTGSCEFEIPEALFDLDIAGMYFRRIKNVALSIPCVTGPYVSVNAKLSLLKHSLRVVPKTDAEDSTALRIQHGFFSSVITSNAQNDAGMFEPNLRDERYLPFEGAGAVGTRWKLELPGFEVTDPSDPSNKIRVGRQFDYSTVSDVLLHMQYTGRIGGGSFQKLIEAGLKEQLNELKNSLPDTGLLHLFSMKRDFPDEWHQIKSQLIPPEAPTILDAHLPYYMQILKPYEISIEAYWSKQDDDQISGVATIFPKTIDSGVTDVLFLVKVVQDKSQ